MAVGLPAAQPAAAEVPASVTGAFDAVTGEARYANSTWGWDVVDMATGESLYRRNANEQFVPGSIIKDYAAAAVLRALGPGYRFRTPVHALGRVRRGVLRGDLALVGTGDFSFGLRNRPDDTLAFTDFDHNEAGTLPFAQQLEGVDPLAGVRQLARAVRRSGIRRVSGDVVVDNRLFTPFDGWPDGPIDSIWINENLIDITVAPTSPGRRATVRWRPHTSAYRVVSRAKTTPPGGETALSVEDAGHGVIEVHGEIPAGADPQLQKFVLPDPARFARTAFVEALERAGVRVDAPAPAPNRQRLLPRRGRYPSGSRVAQFVSPPLSEYVKIVLKVSYNRGAQLFGCLVAVARGSRDCNDAAAGMMRTVTPLGVSPASTFLFDPAGSIDVARATPGDMTAFHRAVAGQPYGPALEAGLPILGRDGSLATTLEDSPAAGHVFAKTGTRATNTPDGRTLLLAQTLVGYITTQSGRRLSFALMVNNVPLREFTDILDIFRGQGLMTEALQQSL
ncbi:D-alanyl-D-alanine carboxypeptidase/D-alanyl-D-alanine endopeptidase [Capillimicrobium parvum]|nr:D-alanyl-D-alanine carboxypeptidase/D-alanyl-D-alanine-endopeptidase [Capillimicrobium parvum]